MSKSLVVAQHSAGPYVNGTDNCHARVGHGGMCPGVRIAAWLNQLEDDDAFYIAPTSMRPQGVTNLQVRQNYVRNGEQHVVFMDAEMADLVHERTRLKNQLSAISRRIKQLEETRAKARKPLA